MKLQYDITVWVNCEYCLTRKYSDEDIMKMIWLNMPDETYDKIVEDLNNNGIEIEDMSEQNFYQWAKIDYSCRMPFFLDRQALDGYTADEDTAIGIVIAIETDRIN